MFDPANTLPLISETYIIKSFRVTNNTGLIHQLLLLKITL